MTTIVAGVVMFTTVVVALVLVLLAARSRLVGDAMVHIEINGDPTRSLDAKAGRTLLNTLAAEEIFVPSACGGQGTCGVCKVVIRSGGGALLPTETDRIDRGEARRGVRLACQARVREDLSIEIPEEVFGIRKWQCRVRSNRNVATFIKEVILELPEGDPLLFRPGGYIQLHVPPGRVAYSDFDISDEYRDDWDKYGLLALESTVTESDDVQRAYSMANEPGEPGVVVLNVRVAPPPPAVPDAAPGKASSYVFSLRAGDSVTISGPYGEFFAKETNAEMVYIGGGAGMAPLRSHILDLFHRRETTRRVSYWYGARSVREAFYVEDFERLAAEHDNFSWCLVLSEPQPEDGWTGPTGFIHRAVYDRYLKNHEAPEEVEYYLCGPPAMLHACLEMLDDLGVPPKNILYDEF